MFKKFLAKRFDPFKAIWFTVKFPQKKFAAGSENQRHQVMGLKLGESAPYMTSKICFPNLMHVSLQVHLQQSSKFQNKNP